MIYGAEMFEVVVSNIFREAGYTIKRNTLLVDGSDIDIFAKRGGKNYSVEVKFANVTERAIQKICAVAEKYDATPVLVTARVIKEEQRNVFEKEYPSVVLVDISNLLYAVQGNNKLYNQLVAVLSYSVDDIQPKKSSIDLNFLIHDDYTQSLIKEMEQCKSGNGMAREYEVLCHELLKNIFSKDLALWKEQQQSNNNLYRFDLLCRIKDGNEKTFWSIIERYFNSKYVVFEFKNYANTITQKEIYTTEKYLYAKALRSVGFIISANGYDKNAYWAVKGCLRENGKLILLLSTDDLIKMNEMKIYNEDPADYLLEKLDELLLDLEK